MVPKLVKNDQRGFIPGRRILDNVMEFQVWREGLQGEEGMLLLDFAKAYDRVDHKYLDRVLRRMGIPTKVRGVIQDLYC